MKKPEIVDFKPEHIRDILEKQGIPAHMIEECLMAYQSDGSIAYTMIVGDQIVCCGGIVNLNWGRGEAWMVPGPLFLQYTKSCYKVIKEKIEVIAEETRYRRIHSLVNPKSPIARNFMKHLGFTKEGKLRKYGPFGNDLLMFARIFEWT